MSKHPFVPTVPYLSDTVVKPYSVDRLGYVTFTDGRNTDVKANQRQCEQYGYKYDSSSGTCRAFSYNDSLIRAVSSELSAVKGIRNNLGTSTTSSVLGNFNISNGMSRNLTIGGEGNFVEAEVNNALVYGTKAQALATNSLVIGGNNQDTDILGCRQFTYIMFAATTTSGSYVIADMNNEAGSRYKVPENAGVYFTSDIFGVRVGGVGVTGAVGDFGSWNEQGVVISSATPTIGRTRTTGPSTGDTSNWRAVAILDSDANLTVKVRGDTDQIVDWVITMRITQMQTSVTL